jgi:predicted TIM-barrel fold metal-dependent hydrolase
MDYPYVFERDVARTYLENSSLNSDERSKVAHGNWERLMAARKH